MALQINNEIYESLGDRWYTADDDPVALLRAEARFRNPWVLRTIQKYGNGYGLSVLDIGCGAGFLTNFLAKQGYAVVGVDSAEGALCTAEDFDETRKVVYLQADAMSLPFEDGTFDVVTMMDFLEHVEDPMKAIEEASRVLAPGGLFFYHTFNRNFLSWLVAIKGVEWFVKNTPKHMHLFRMFIKPAELHHYMEMVGIKKIEEFGSRPALDSSFWKLLMTRRVPKTFSFQSTKSRVMGYCGVGLKE